MSLSGFAVANCPRIVFVAVALMLVRAAAVSAVPPPVDFETPVVIENARIVVEAGRTIERGSIVIDGGRIVAVGERVDAPPDAEVIDASGLTIYPGLIDACTHAGITFTEPADDDRRRLEDESPDVRDGPQSATVEAHRRLVHPRVLAEEHFDPAMAGRDEMRAAGFTAALASPKPAVFAGSSALLQMGDRPLRRSVLRAPVAQHAAFVTGRDRGDFPRSFERAFEMPQYPTTIMGAMAAFRQIMLDAAWQKDWLDWSRRNPAGPPAPVDRDLGALQDVRDGRVPVAFYAQTENEIHRALDLAAEFRLRPIIVGAAEGWRAAERLKRESVPVILSVKWPEEPKPPGQRKSRKPGPTPADEEGGSSTTHPTTTSRPAGALDPVFDDEWEDQPFEPQRLFEERKRLWEERVDNARRLEEAGVVFAVGSYEMKSATEVLKNLRKAVERGLSADAALTALTRRAAEIVGAGDALGTIQSGRLANLTAVTGPLFEEKTEVRWVFVAGRRHDAKAADSPRGRGEGRRGGGRRGAGAAPAGEESEPEEEEGGSKPTPPNETATGPATTTSTQPAWPTFRCEIEADRAPRLRTGGNVLIRGATLLTITAGDRPETDLLIENGRIARMGKGIAAPPGATVIDLPGYFVMPGIIDPHSHMCSDGGLNEFSLSVTCEVRVRDVIGHRDVQAFRALAGGTTTIHTMHGSANTIGGQNVVLRLKYGRPAAEWVFREAPQTVKFALGENVKQSNIGRRGTRFPNSRMGVEAVIRRSFDAAREYREDWSRYDSDRRAGKDPRPLRRDLRLEALADILEGRIWVHSHCYRADEILRLLDVAEDYGLRIGVLQHVLDGYRLIPEMRRHGCGASTFSDWWAYKIEAYDAIPHNAARMIQGGVVATVNSDSPELVRHLNLEAAKSMRFGGLGVNDCLRLCTLNGAIQLGVERYVGSIEAGKVADLAVFDGHPLDTFSRCVLTLIDGEVYFQHEALGDLAQQQLRPAARPAKPFLGPRAPLRVRPSPGGRFILRGGEVFPIVGEPIERGEVLIADGRIEYVGPVRSTASDAEAAVIDTTDLRVYPGLINGGSSLGLTEIESVAGSVDAGDIGRFQPDLVAASAWNPFASAIEVARSEGVLATLVVPGGDMVSGRGSVMRLDGWSMPESVVRSPFGLFVSLPSLPVEFPEWMPEERRAEQKKETRQRLAEVEAFFRQARHFAAVAELAGRRPGYRYHAERRLESMMPFVRREAPVFFRADGYKQIREALRFAERYDLWPVIYGGREAWKLADPLAAAKVDVVIVRSMAYPGGDHEPWDSVYRNAAVLDQAGVRFCFATGGASLAKLLGIEAGMAVAYGLDARRALEAVTIDAARILGVDDRLGSLERGKAADLIVTSGDPLQADNSVVAAFVAGHPVDLSNRHTRTDRKFLSRPTPSLEDDPTLRGPAPMRLPPSDDGT